MKYEELSKEILEMAKVDQDYRLGWFKNRGKPEYLAGQIDIDAKHTERLKQIVAEIGWPTIDRVGAAASHAAWLLIQHATHDSEFQQSCLALIEKADSKIVDKRQLAYLTDKVRIHQNRPQLYGTQYKSSSAKLLPPFPIEDADNVDRRRAECGLPPMDPFYDVDAMEQAEKSGHVTSFSDLDGYKYTT